MYARAITVTAHPGSLLVLDHGHPIEFALSDIAKYHGTGSPGGVALAFKAMQRALPLLVLDEAPERREITVRTAFAGPGARDAFECVLRAVTEDRYLVDPSLERADLPSTRSRFVFAFAYRERVVTLTVRTGIVASEFIELLASERTAAGEARLTELKRELADRVTATAPADAFDAVESH